MHSKVVVLAEFKQAMLDSSDDEWANFIREQGISRLTGMDKDKFFLHESSYRPDFESWILGRELDKK